MKMPPSTRLSDQKTGQNTRYQEKKRDEEPQAFGHQLFFRLCCPVSTIASIGPTPTPTQPEIPPRTWIFAKSVGNEIITRKTKRFRIKNLEEVVVTKYKLLIE